MQIRNSGVIRLTNFPFRNRFPENGRDMSKHVEGVSYFNKLSSCYRVLLLCSSWNYYCESKLSSTTIFRNVRKLTNRHGLTSEKICIFGDLRDLRYS